MRLSMMVLTGVVAMAASSSAFAATVVDGTVSSVATFNPTVSLTSNPSTYTANGGTFNISGTGGFSGISGTTGALKGTLSFSQSVGNTIAQSVSNFFTFNDKAGSTYSFSADSVRTDAFVNDSATKSGTLFVLGNVLNNSLGLTSTPASLTVQFNSTGNSAYSSALSLSVPPIAGGVPEPATWAMMVIGVGAIGGAMRRRQKVSTRVSFG